MPKKKRTTLGRGRYCVALPPELESSYLAHSARNLHAHFAPRSLPLSSQLGGRDKTIADVATTHPRGRSKTRKFHVRVNGGLLPSVRWLTRRARSFRKNYVSYYASTFAWYRHQLLACLLALLARLLAQTPPFWVRVARKVRRGVLWLARPLFELSAVFVYLNYIYTWEVFNLYEVYLFQSLFGTPEDAPLERYRDRRWQARCRRLRAWEEFDDRGLLTDVYYF